MVKIVVMDSIFFYQINGFYLAVSGVALPSDLSLVSDIGGDLRVD